MRRCGVPATTLGLVAIAVAALGCGAGDEFVTGIANGGNRFYANRVIDELADQLVGSGVVQPVTDEMLRTSFDAIARSAAEGDPEAALILFRLAEVQRTQGE